MRRRMSYDYDEAMTFRYYCDRQLAKDGWTIDYANEWWLAFDYFDGVAKGYEDADDTFYEILRCEGYEELTEAYDAWAKCRRALFNAIPEEAVRSITAVHDALTDDAVEEDLPRSDLHRRYHTYRKPYAVMLAVYNKLVAINHPDDVEEDDALLPDDMNTQ